jgi:hypothetical protein
MELTARHADIEHGRVAARPGTSHAPLDRLGRGKSGGDALDDRVRPVQFFRNDNPIFGALLNQCPRIDHGIGSDRQGRRPDRNRLGPRVGSGRQRRALHDALAVLQFGPVALRRHRDARLPAGLRDGVARHSVLLRQLQHRLRPDLFVEHGASDGEGRCVHDCVVSSREVDRADDGELAAPSSRCRAMAKVGIGVRLGLPRFASMPSSAAIWSRLTCRSSASRRSANRPRPRVPTARSDGSSPTRPRVVGALVDA